MVFCCIAIVAFAIMYFCFLTLRQLFSRPRRDKQYPGRVPPRAITGNGALPVYGHTRLFTKWGGNVALLFTPDMYEWSGCAFCSRKLGVLYSIFIWGQWRIVIQGAERVQQILQQASLKEGWPWTPPITLLGKSCLDLLEPADADVLANFLQATLRPSEVLCYAPAFAELAEVNLQNVANRKGHHHHNHHHIINGNSGHSNNAWSDQDDDDKILDDRTHKIKWEALRSYSLDLIDGPILNMHLWTAAPSPAASDTTTDDCNRDVELGVPEPQDRKKMQAAEKRAKKAASKIPHRHLALLWMERIKSGLCVIKMTFGAEWMQIWRLNEYGRALNARRYVEKLVSDHVAERVKNTPTPITHAPGHFIHDWLTAPFPLLTLTENLRHFREGVLGDGKPTRPIRQRSKSDSMIVSTFRTCGWEDDDGTSEYCMYLTSLNTEQDLAVPQFESPPRSSQKLKALLSAAMATSENIVIPTQRQDLDKHPTTFVMAQGSDGKFRFEQSSGKLTTTPSRRNESQIQKSESVNGFTTPPALVLPRRHTFVDSTATANNTPPAPVTSPNPTRTEPTTMKKPKRLLPLLDRLIRQEEREGKGISQATITEVSILLWMIMDAGNAWTAMALNLISSNEEACTMVQDELDYLAQIYGRDQLFTPIVLSRMKHLDALVYEAIRLCPPFLGGMKVTQETSVFPELDLQVPKNCNVFFCQATHENFDLANAVGKRPEMLGFQYPCPEVHGFLPLKGLEVPLMVLQTKVYLAVLLQRFSPYVSKRRTFIRRVTQVLTCSFSHKDFQTECYRSTSSSKVQDEMMYQSQCCLQDSDEFHHFDESMEQHNHMHHHHHSTTTARNLKHAHEITQSDAMRLFSKIPFPEPRRVIHIRERDGVTTTTTTTTTAFEQTTPPSLV